MTLRTRVTLAAGFAVLVAVVVVSTVVYFVVSNNLHDQVDSSLSHRPLIPAGQAHEAAGVPQHLPLVEDVFLQVVDREGEIVTAFDDRRLPITDEVLDVARGGRQQVFFNANINGRRVRVYAASAGQGVALEVGRSLDEVDEALRRLAWTLVVISFAGVLLAVALGRLVAAAATAPLHRVAEAAEAVARTGDLSHHIAAPLGDDLGRLAASFNSMLDALSDSLAQQRQLVADASHELRTPLATVRTNVEVLARADQLPADERNMLLRDTVAQLGELSRLVGDLMELARGAGEQEPFVLLDLDEVARHAVEVAQRNHPSITFRLDGVRSLIQGAPGRIEKAVSNLIDNAAKWSPAGGDVEIAVGGGIVSVRDHGPGIDPADLPHVFDRFYRSPQARSMPGSGLGLAIVKHVADAHAGSVTASSAPEGGALLVLRFPPAGSQARDERRAENSHRTHKVL